jgi:DNA-binding transcriptional MocR family regulator
MPKFASRMEEVSASAIREILKLMADPEIISFSGGSPTVESFPINTIKQITDEALFEIGNQVLRYGTTEEFKPLREAYLKRVANPKGVKSTIKNVIITTGATQGIQLVADVFLNPGGTVLVEDPTS